MIVNFKVVMYSDPKSFVSHSRLTRIAVCSYQDKRNRYAVYTSYERDVYWEKS
jgi:hypothetical protein